MGCFHDGHFALMRDAAERADTVVTSLFVNPLQFGPDEDFDRYPRTFLEDREGARANRVHVLFAPDQSLLYPDGFQSAVLVKELTRNLCGRSRTGHFEGVTTVVAKLFNIVKPTVAVFGQKDFQQLAVIRKMVKDLDWDIEIIGHPIVRDSDGLALSSRNKYLSAEERQSALSLSTALKSARDSVRAGLVDSGSIIKKAVETITSVPFTEIDYVSIVDEKTLLDQDIVTSASVMALAVRVGKTRLIDNAFLMANS